MAVSWGVRAACRGVGGQPRVPLVVWVLLVWPLLMSAMHSAAGQDVSYRQALVLARPPLDTGPMWFVELLLLYSLAYAAWNRRTAGPSRPVVLLRVRMLVGLGLAARWRPSWCGRCFRC